MSAKANDVESISILEAHLSAGFECQKNRQWQKAAEHFQRAIDLSPASAQSHHQLGLIWSKLNRLDIALSCHRTALELDPESHAYCVVLADVLSQKKMHIEAIESYKRCIEIKPSDVSAYHKLGDLLLKKGRFAEAVSAYKGAIDLETENSWSYHNLGRAYFRLCLYRDALPYIQRAIQLHPNLANFRRSKGDVLAAEGRTQEALDAYAEAIELDSKNADLHVSKGELYSENSRFSEAIPCFVDAIKCEPQHRLAYRQLGIALHENGDISSDERQGLNNFYVPDRIVDSLFEFRDIGEADLDSDELSCLVSEVGETVVLSPKSFTAPEPLPGGISPESYLEDAKVSPAHLLDIKDGRAWGDGVNSAVMTASGKLISSVSTRNSKIVAGISENHEAIRIEGVTAFISQKFASGNNYFHWFFQDIARLHLLELAGIELASVDKFVFAQIQKDFQREVLEVFGIPDSKVIQSIHEPHVSARRLLVPSPTEVIGTGKWACRFLHESFSKAVSSVDANNAPEKIYISRNSSPYRRVVNEDELMPMLEEHGYECVQLETLSIQQKVALLSGVKAIVAPHGAALTNLVFCSPGCTVVEMFPKSVMDAGPLIGPYPVIAKHCMLEHYYFFGDDLPNHEAKPQLRKDIIVDLDLFRNMLVKLD